MAEPIGCTRALAYLRREQVELFRAAAERAGLEVAALGVEGRAEAGPVQAALECFPRAEPVDDLRYAITSADVAAVVLGAAPDGGAGEGVSALDAAVLCAKRGVRLITLTPIPASLQDVRAPEALSDSVRLVPLLRDSRVFASASDVLSGFGSIRTLSVASRCGAAHGSLGARLFDAMLTVHAILGVPESIDASIIAPGAAAGVHTAPAESLARLEGDLTANLRFAGPHAASLSLSDRAGRWFRGVTLLGESGALRIDESGFELIGPDGATLDRSAPRAGGREERETPHAAAIEVLAEAFERAVDPRAPKPAPIDRAAVLAMCEAAMLSARTGQAESPATVLRMNSLHESGLA